VNCKGWLQAGVLIFGTLALSVSVLAQDGPQTPPTRQDTSRKESKSESKKESKKEAREEAAAGLPAVIMEDRDPRSLNLYYGPGGQQEAPSAEDGYKFVDEDLKQTSAKFDVDDAQGRRWRVKLGAEPRSETAATRLVWAAGYFVDDDYYLDQITVPGMPALHRGGRFVHGDQVRKVRLELKPKEVKSIGSWEWFDNPFMGTRELNGLRVLMALVENWDLITRNNSIYDVDGQRRFLISDLGASLGKSGNELTRSKGEMKAFANTKFIDKTTADTVDFAIHARPLPFTVLFMPHYYLDLADGQQVYKNIPRADARWIGQKLALLSESQIRDCFRAAGYSPEDVDGYTRAIQKRIADLNAL
jgi:hypothetical protein